MTFIELAHAATSNPGAFTELASNIPSWLVPAVAVISSLAAVFGLLAILIATEAPVRKVKLAFIGFGLICAVIAVGGVSGVLTATDDLAERRADARTAYTTAVSDWLEADYGIDANTKQSSRLADGDSFVVDYNGKPTTISVVENLDGDLAVVDENRSPLTPRGE